MKKIKYLLGLLATIVILITQLVQDIDVDLDKYFGREIQYSSASIEELISGIETGEIHHIDYDRSEWEAAFRFVSPVTNEKESLRDYSVQISSYTKYYNNDDRFLFVDPYTGASIKELEDIEYDHVIPISYAAVMTNNSWSEDQKLGFSYDLLNGVPVSKTENREKGNKGPSEYLPDIRQEEYCYTWLLVSEKYGIPLLKQDLRVIQNILKDTEYIEIISKYNFEN